MGGANSESFASARVATGFGISPLRNLFVRLEELLLRELPFLSAERETLFPPVESATEKMTDLRSATESAQTLGGDSREKTTYLTRQRIGDS